MRFFVFLVFSCFVVFGVTVFFRLGGYKGVYLEKTQSEPLYLIYREHLGPYHEINDVIESVEKDVLALNLPCPKTFGEYLDDPRTRDEDRLKSIGGCVLPIALPIEEADLKDLESSRGVLSYKEIEPRDIIYAKFEGAPSIGPFKVYPRAEKKINKKGLRQSAPVIEFYTIFSSRKAMTEYHFPVTEAQW